MKSSQEIRRKQLQEYKKSKAKISKVKKSEKCKENIAPKYLESKGNDLESIGQNTPLKQFTPRRDMSELRDRLFSLKNSIQSTPKQLPLFGIKSLQGHLENLKTPRKFEPVQMESTSPTIESPLLKTLVENVNNPPTSKFVYPCSRLQWLKYGKIKLQVVQQGLVQKSEILHLPVILVFSLEDAKTASTFNSELASCIFKILANTHFTKSDIVLQFNEDKWKRVNTPFKFQPMFWLQWARFEESIKNFEACASVFEQAIQVLEANDLQLIQGEYQEFLERICDSLKHVQVYQSAFQIPREYKPGTPKLNLECDQDSSFSSEDLPEALIKEETFEDNIQEPILESQLSSMNINFQDTLVKKQDDTNGKDEPLDISIKAMDANPRQKTMETNPEARPKTKRVGVVIPTTEGSTRTVLTPVKLKKKEPLAITPVRRSLRLMEDIEYDVNTETVSDLSGKVEKLLEQHDYNYVPNKNLSFRLRK